MAERTTAKRHHLRRRRPLPPCFTSTQFQVRKLQISTNHVAPEELFSIANSNFEIRVAFD